METIDSKKMLQELSFVVIDLETTGGDHNADKIIEIGLIKVENLKIIDELHYLINPERSIPPFVQNLTSIFPKDLTHSPKIQDVIDEILEFMGNSIIVAHNLSFDFPFFNSVLRRLERPALSNRSLCTLLMSQYLIPNILSSNLKYMCQLFDISHAKAHRALEDAKACAQLLLKFLDIFIEKGIRKVNQIYYPPSKFELNMAYFSKDQCDQFLYAIEKITSNATIKFTGENGTPLAVLALESPSLEKKIVCSMMKMFDYKTITVQLMGSFFEAFLVYNFYYNKIEEQVNEHILSYLNKKYLGNLPLKFDFQNYIKGVDPKNFLVTHHLIPGQLLIYPLFNLYNESFLAFRFPAHEKRILNYTHRQIRNMGPYKKNRPRHFIHKDLFPFLDQYLKKAKKEKNKGYLFVNESIIRNDENKFYNSIRQFLKPIQKKKSYPKRHI